LPSPDYFVVFVFIYLQNLLDAQQPFLSQSQLLDSFYPTVDLLVLPRIIMLPSADLPTLRDISYLLTVKRLNFIVVFLAVNVILKSTAQLENPSNGKISATNTKETHTK